MTSITHPLPMDTWVTTYGGQVYRIMLPASTTEGDGYVCFERDQGGATLFVWSKTINEARLPDGRVMGGRS